MVSEKTTEYWKRRKHVNVTRNEDGEIISATPAPLRGQTNTIPKPTIAKWNEEDLAKNKCTSEQVGKERISGVKYTMLPGGLTLPTNRAKRRQRIVNRKFTKKGYTYGTKTNSREYNIIHHIAKRQAA